MSIRPVQRIIESKPAIEGTGVRLRRAFGFGDTREFDPSYSMTSATSIRRTIVPDFHGTHTAASRRLPMC
jgi:hypothetical protein